MSGDVHTHSWIFLSLYLPPLLNPLKVPTPPARKSLPNKSTQHLLCAPQPRRSPDPADSSSSVTAFTCRGEASVQGRPSPRPSSARAVAPASFSRRFWSLPESRSPVAGDALTSCPPSFRPGGHWQLLRSPQSRWASVTQVRGQNTAQILCALL